MKAYAVIATGGKQYRVQEQDVLEVEKLTAEAGATIELAPVLAISDGTKASFGQPVLQGIAVSAVVVGHKRGEKVISFKKKRRKGYSKKIGHRQDLTVLKITGIPATAAV